MNLFKATMMAVSLLIAGDAFGHGADSVDHTKQRLDAAERTIQETTLSGDYRTQALARLKSARYRYETILQDSESIGYGDPFQPVHRELDEITKIIRVAKRAQQRNAKTRS